MGAEPYESCRHDNISLMYILRIKDILPHNQIQLSQLRNLMWLSEILSMFRLPQVSQSCPSQPFFSSPDLGNEGSYIAFSCVSFIVEECRSNPQPLFYLGRWSHDSNIFEESRPIFQNVSQFTFFCLLIIWFRLNIFNRKTT